MPGRILAGESMFLCAMYTQCQHPIGPADRVLAERVWMLLPEKASQAAEQAGQDIAVQRIQLFRGRAYPRVLRAAPFDSVWLGIGDFQALLVSFGEPESRERAKQCFLFTSAAGLEEAAGDAHVEQPKVQNLSVRQLAVTQVARVTPDREQVRGRGHDHEGTCSYTLIQQPVDQDIALRGITVQSHQKWQFRQGAG